MRAARFVLYVLLCCVVDVTAQTIDLKDVGIPLSIYPRTEQLIYKKGYTASYNKETKTPNWVAWHLNRDHITGDVPRPGAAFHEDTQVPLPRATNDDYKGSGWSRGHMCPAGDNKWDEDAMYESFLLTNVCPQHASLNSGIWNQIEILCRKWAEKYGDLDIVCGPIYFNQEHDTIGVHRVVVPEAFFKVILCQQDGPKGIGFICRNTAGDKKKDFYVNSISQVEHITGYVFFPGLLSETAKQVKMQANIDDW